MSARARRRRDALQKQVSTEIGKKLDLKKRKDEVARIEREQEEWAKEKFGPHMDPAPGTTHVSSRVLQETKRLSKK